MSNSIAPDGQVYVCGACGKRSKDRYGYQSIDPGWDESCMLNSVLVYEDSIKLSLDGYVIECKAVAKESEKE